MCCGSSQLNIVLNQHAVVQNSDSSRTNELTARNEDRSAEDDVVSLPLTRWATGIHQRWVLAVNRGSLSICVRFVVVGVQHLNFIFPHQKHAAVAPLLARSPSRQRRGPF